MAVLVRCVVMLGMLLVVPLGPGPVPQTFGLLRGTRRALRGVLVVAHSSAMGSSSPLRSIPPGSVCSLRPRSTGQALALIGGDAVGRVRRYWVPTAVAGVALAAMVAGLVCRAAGDAVAARRAAPAVPVGTLVVLVGFFTGAWVELAGAAVLTAGMWLVAWLTWRQVRPRARDLLTRALLGAAALTVVATMVLALSWAHGEAAGVPHPSVEWMAATHGVANAVAFGACAVLAWRRLRVEPL